jgi:hypothetical protein
MDYYGNGWDLGKGSNEAGTSVFSNPQYGGSTVPSFSLAADGSPVTRHMAWAFYRLLGSAYDGLFTGGAEKWTGDEQFMGIVMRQNFEEHNSVLGQLRLIEAFGNHVSEGSLVGDGTRLSVAKETSTRGGLVVPWTGPTTLPIF